MKPALTALRKEILSIIMNASKPLSAKSIFKAVSSMPNLSTIYRALEYFETHSQIQSISLAGTKYFYTSAKKGYGHFITCKECHEIIEFEECAIDTFQRKIQKKFGYIITGHTLYFEGFCADCSQYAAKKSKNTLAKGGN
jgi:Fur family transcriptional regulator, ferric uptake regulator